MQLESFVMHQAESVAHTAPAPQVTRSRPVTSVLAKSLPIALLAILSLSLGLRLYAINWDQGGLFHPDERAILMESTDLRIPEPSEYGDLLTKESPLNPGWFNYGSLPLYMLKAVQLLAAPITEPDPDLFDMRLPGRVMSALADTATVVLIYLIGVRWYGRRVGITAAALAALAVIHIQLSHFYAVDTILTMFVAAAVFFSIRVAQTGSRRDSVLAGLMLGFGLATKVSIAPAVIPVIAGHAVYAFSRRGEFLDLSDAGAAETAPRRWHAFSGLVLAGAVALAALLVTQPYMVIDWRTFVANVTEQSEMVRRIRDYPYTRQYIDTPAYVYQAWQVGVWGLGPVLGLTAWLGLAGSLVVAWFGRRKADVVILSWVIPYLLITGWFDVKFMRYMLPLTPFLILYGARLLWWAVEGLRVVAPQRRLLTLAPLVVVMIATAHYAIAFTNAESGQHPAYVVSNWLRENAEPGSVLLQEHWDEGIPHVPGTRYLPPPNDRLAIYDFDTPQKFERIAGQLADADYFIIFSNRLYGTVSRLPDTYPQSDDFYRALFSGALGYELVHSPGRTPSFLGIGYRADRFARVDLDPPAGFQPPGGELATLNMGWADESFTVYDHPQPMVFRNTARMSQVEILDSMGVFSVSGPPQDVGLLMSDEDAAVQQAGGTWTSIAFLRSVPDGLSWLVWLVAAQILALAALPLSFVIFRSLPDRGYLFAKPLGLLLSAVLAWLLASLGWVGFSFASVLGGVLAVAAISLVAWNWYGREIVSFYRHNRRSVLIGEALFLAAFLSFVVIRAANPDLWHPFRGGEKPMDFAYLNAVTRSTLMPPYDPWFAGGYLNYYYFGQFIVASMIRLTGLDPAVAYNLAVPLLFALTFVGAFSIVYNLAALTLAARGVPLASTRSPIYAGIAAAVLVAVAGNIDGLVQVGEGLVRVIGSNLPFGRFDYWRSSRMMEPGSPGNEITEFPFFTFLFADLHAHLIAIPFAVLGLGIGLGVLVRAGRRRPVLESWGSLAVLGVTIGALRIINTWDYPTALAIAATFILIGETLFSRQRVVRGLAMTAVKVAFVAVVGHVVFLPFHQSFELFNNGVQSSETQTPLWRYLGIHSIFLFLLLSWLVFEWRENLAVAGRRIADVIHDQGLPTWVAPVAVIFGVAVLGAFALAGYATAVFAVILAAVTLAIGWLLMMARAPGSRYALAVAAMAAAALGLGAAVDVFTVKGDIGRMNTVFKFYLQAWVLLALASGYFLWVLGTAGRLRSSGRLWKATLAVLVIGVMIYPVLGTRARISDRFATSDMGLDGTAYMEYTTHFSESGPLPLETDLEAIEWLQRNVEGSPVIIEGLTDLYRWGNRVSIYTGLPAVIGWDWHQRQQRVDYAWAVTQRRAEVDRFYSTDLPTEALLTLDRYDVRYVYVGELERQHYPASGLEKFNQMAAHGLLPVYESDAVTIYEYTPPRQVTGP